LRKQFEDQQKQDELVSQLLKEVKLSNIEYEFLRNDITKII
jgi:hypothetical protein